jgi:hypothetical protein
MTQAFWTAMWPNMKEPPALKDMLIGEAVRKPAKRDWQEIKAALIVAFAPTPTR